MTAPKAPDEPLLHSLARVATIPVRADRRPGRPPKKAFINVLVRISTRHALAQLKLSIGLPSQGEVIDYLVAERTHAQRLAARR